MRLRTEFVSFVVNLLGFIYLIYLNYRISSNITRTFTGQVFDNETGLMLYRNRFYHTGLGRFVNRDPIGYEAGDVSLYRYVGDGVTGYVDPNGLQKPDHLMPGQPDNPFNPNTPFSRPNKKQTWLKSMRKRLDECLKKKKICGEEAEKIKKQLNDFIQKAEDTPSKMGCRANDCVLWVAEVGDSPLDSPGILDIKGRTWDYRGYIYTTGLLSKDYVLGHAAIEVKICDEHLFYFDDG